MQRYRRIEDRVSNLYINSVTHRFVRKMSENIKRYFSFSSINKISSAEGKNTIAIIDESRVVRYIASTIKAGNESIAASAVRAVMEAVSSFPTRSIGVFVTVSLLVNIILIVAMGQKMDLFGWFIRCAFLFVGFAALSSGADWKKTKATSILSRKIGDFN